MVKFMYHNNNHSSQPHHYLSGTFTPVSEETPPTTNLLVKGHLPECLNGEFVRVGPNPKFTPVAGYHCMVHGLRIKDGKANYVSRYVRTSKLQQEEYFGGAKFLKLGDLKGLFGLIKVIMQMLREKLKVLDVSYGTGTGNTALIYHHGKLLALQEADKPYVLKVLEDGDLQTLGMLDYDKRLVHSFTAHPKVDPFTGEMFTFGYSTSPPYITYRVISKDGFMHDPVPITISEPIMMHDFAITENYAIFMDLPLCFRKKEMVTENKLILKFDTTKKARFGVLPRYAKDELQIRWFELPSCFIFHNANAWEEEDEVVLITCRYENIDMDRLNGIVKEELKILSSELYEMRFNMKTGLASQKKLSKSVVEFPRVNESYTGRRQRFGSEAIFVPRVPGMTSEEDDGYLIFFVHDENTGKSSVNVLDAKTMSADPVAVVEIPHRVPPGFHAFFVTEEQLQEQGKS
nr:carotenoid 9,10(9',10')-cleavage dioxygenase 1 [Quercus suber]